MADLTPAQQAARDAARERIRQREAERLATPKERLRTAAQGLTFGFGEEMEAAAREPVSAIRAALGAPGGEAYERRLADLRESLGAYREAYPVSSTAYEVGGAMVPGVLAAPFTGGASLPAAAGGGARGAARTTLGRIGQNIAMGGAGAALAGFGTAEGGPAERAMAAASGALVGGPATAILGETMRLTAYPAARVIDWARRKLGGRGARAVEAELQRLAEGSNLSVDDIVRGIEEGRIMAENKTLLSAVRGYAAQGGEAAERLKTVFRERPGRTREEAMGEIQRYLSDVGESNVLRGVRRSDEQARAAERQAYALIEDMEAPPDVVDALGNALRRVPGSVEEVNIMLRAETGKAPFFRIDDETGEVIFQRPPTIGEAEKIRRAIGGKATSLYRSGMGGAGSAVQDVERALRGQIDVGAPEMAAARGQAATVRTARDAFEGGQTIFSKSSDEVEIDFNRIVGLGPEALRSYRAGAMDALRRKIESGQRLTLMRNLANPETKEGRIFRTIFPQDQLDQAMMMIERAEGAQSAAQGVLNMSATAANLREMSQQGIDINTEDVSGILSGDPFALVRTARKIVSRMGGNLTDAQRSQIVDVLVSEDPAFVRNALQDQSGMAMLQQRINDVSRRVLSGSMSGAAYMSGAAGGGLITGPR